MVHITDGHNMHIRKLKPYLPAEHPLCKCTVLDLLETQQRPLHALNLSIPMHLFLVDWLLGRIYQPCFLSLSTRWTTALNPSLNRLLHLSLFSLFLFNPGRS